MIDKKSWKEFQNTGLMLFVNQFLHIFGWSLVFEMEGEEIKSVYPARVGFRGFGNKDTSEAYEKITEYMCDNVYVLESEVKEK